MKFINSSLIRLGIMNCDVQQLPLSLALSTHDIQIRQLPSPGHGSLDRTKLQIHFHLPLCQMAIVLSFLGSVRTYLLGPRIDTPEMDGGRLVRIHYNNINVAFEAFSTFER